MHICTLFLFVVLLKVRYGENAKILAIFPIHGRSHFNMFETYLKGLAERGHEVDVVSNFPQTEPIERYTDISIKGILPDIVNNLPLDAIKNVNMLNFMLNEIGIEVCKAFFTTDIAKRLRETTKKYDLIVTELFSNNCLLGYSYVLKVPVITLTTSVNLPWASDLFGLPDNPSYIPTYFNPSTSEMNLFERIWNTYDLIYSKLMYEFVSYPAATRMAKEFFGSDLPDIKLLSNNISLLLVNSHLSIHQARPMVPNVKEVGGLHIAKEKSLSKYFEDAVQTNFNGIVYLSFGSMLMTESFDLNVLNGLFAAIEELPYKVLWKADKSRFPIKKFPNNVQFEKWMPQLDILCHPNVKLFITHGGLMGLEEATYCGKPVLGVPLFADQGTNLINVESKGRGLHLVYENITKENVLSIAIELLENPKYKKNCEMASKIFKDRPLKPLDEALYWTEYVLRYGGAPQLRTKGSKLPWYQYFLIDVILIVLAILTVCTFIIYVTIKCLIRACVNKKIVKQLKIT